MAHTRYNVRCPIHGGPDLHMTFSRIYESEEDAQRHCNQIRCIPDITAPFTKAGPHSCLYQLPAHVLDGMYNNTRMPHVEGGPQRTIQVMTSRAEVKPVLGNKMS